MGKIIFLQAAFLVLKGISLETFDDVLLKDVKNP
jgi:hypothetical protein